MIEGGCLCGEVRYAIDAQVTDVSHCHCSTCRKVHGAAFGTYGAAGREHFHWEKGEDQVTIFRSSEHMERLFCKLCGSPLLCRDDSDPDTWYITLGTVDGDPGCRPAYHIWVGSKAPWYLITDDLPQFDEDDA